MTRSTYWRAVLCGACCMGAAAFVPAMHGLGALSAAEPSAAKPAEPLPADRLMREGAELTDQLGEFKFSGDRTLFVAGPEKRRFVVLENLNLERVGRILSDNPDALEWSVSGTVTEYRGSNYLYVRRATLRSRVPFKVTPPATSPTSPSTGKPAIIPLSTTPGPKPLIAPPPPPK